ncbi:hypothetical protein L1987_55596 [Smallanthus sonchifolius]|uniref:Uncharacterized protein n=1 Tax=Smallanthus sonchifolius TaxID=185202 RepID=A0ACB9EAC1_9ASTR|nr:hypothetical protein L1987_55596 [Smallanthus sonchifolius]
MNPSLLFHFFIFFTVFTLKAFSSSSSISYSDHCNSYAPEAIPTDTMFTRFLFLEPVTSHYTFLIKMSHRNFTNIRSNHSRVGRKQRHTLVFYLDGFWSVSTSKLCMVGSARWLTKEGNPLKLNAVLKLKFAQFINLNNSLVSGILESLAPPNDFDYFDPISILGFPLAPFKYNYTLVSNEENCSLFGQDNGYLPTFVSLYAIQCSREDNKLRFLVEFQDRRFTRYDQSFRPDISLIGEGTWNGGKDELCIAACPILNQSDPLGSARVGDCSIRLIMWFPAVWSITKTHTTEGQIWNTKFTDDSWSFRMAKFQSFDHSRENYGSKYEYTQMEKVRRNSRKKKSVGPSINQSYTYDMFVKHKNMASSGYAFETFVGSWVFNDYKIVNPSFDPWEVAVPPAVETSTVGPRNISFEISFMLNISSISSGISSLNLSSTDDDRVEISAEGVYDDETGQLCMVACRNLKTLLLTVTLW